MSVLTVSSAGWADDKPLAQINTNTGEKVPATDVGELSTKNKRDFVANPTGFSVGGNIGGGTGAGYGLDIGGRGGYTFPGRIYVGGLGGYAFGTTSGSDIATVRKSSWYLGPEFGYDVGAGALILRPVVGLGLGFSTVDTKSIVGNTNSTTAKMFVSPGAEIMYPIGNVFVGADARYMYMRGNEGVLFMANGGVHL
ncbi:MAG: hypothetical protein ACXWUG_21695 [Polyangiales bacterium]